MAECHLGKRPFDTLTRHGGLFAVGKHGVGLGSMSDSVERGIPFPPPSHRIEGCTPQFFPTFSLEGVCLVDADASRKRLEALCWLCSSGWLPLLRVGCFRGLERL